MPSFKGDIGIHTGLYIHKSHLTFQFPRSILASGFVELEKAQENLGPHLSLESLKPLPV